VSTRTPADLLAAALATRRAELALAERNAVDFPQLADVWLGSAAALRSMLSLLESANAEQSFTADVILKVQCPARHRLASVYAATPHPVLARPMARSRWMYPNLVDDAGRLLQRPGVSTAAFQDVLDGMVVLQHRTDTRSLVSWCRCETSTAVGIREVCDALAACRAVLTIPGAMFRR
jgi:hypothetical protein